MFSYIRTYLTQGQQNKTDESGYNVGLLDYIVGGEMVRQMIKRQEESMSGMSNK